MLWLYHANICYAPVNQFVFQYLSTIACNLLTATTYKITVKTSDVRGAGTDANVYAVFFGQNGQSDTLHLKDSETNKSPFQGSQTDVFTVKEALSLGQLLKCRLWHDNKGFGASWHCSQLEVEDSLMKQKFVFPCNRWLSKSEDDKQIVRELSCANAGAQASGSKDKISKCYPQFFGSP